MSDPSIPPTPAGPPPRAPSAGGDNRTVMIVLSYLYILALVPLLVEKDDAEVQWHAKHGLVLLAVDIIVWVVAVILSIIVGFIPVIGCLGVFLYLIASLVWLALFVVRIVCILKGVKGERFMVPGISQYASAF
jgi:uncharacterized membrane protein